MNKRGWEPSTPCAATDLLDGVEGWGQRRVGRQGHRWPNVGGGGGVGEAGKPRSRKGPPGRSGTMTCSGGGVKVVACFGPEVEDGRWPRRHPRQLGCRGGDRWVSTWRFGYFARCWERASEA
jgi:hypothetical protein